MDFSTVQRPEFDADKAAGAPPFYPPSRSLGGGESREVYKDKRCGCLPIVGRATWGGGIGGVDVDVTYFARRILY